MTRSLSSTVCLLACVLMSCDSGTTPPDPTGAARLEAAGAMAQVVRARLDDATTAVSALTTAVDAWAAAPTDASLRTAAQDQWLATMLAWQHLEPMQVGPAAAMDLGVGGQDLRDRIYSWPIVNACRVDQELAEGAYTDADAFAAEAINVLGLDALEYLLFVDSTTNACAPNSSLNLDGSWDAIVAELPTRRAAYAATLTTLLNRDLATLRAAWDGTDGFLLEVQSAGTGSALFSSAQDALNAISDALFYVDKETKDMKVAGPAGISPDCLTAPCPELRESQYANASIRFVHANLLGTQEMMLGAGGAEPRGFLWLLEELDQAALAAELRTTLQAAIDQAAALGERTVEEVLAESATGLMALYEAIRVFTELLKTQFVTVLDLDLPNRAEGDDD